MNILHPERADALAAAYVLGTLRGPACRRFETLMAAHPSLRQHVQAWEARLAPLQSIIPEEPVPTRVWRRIATRTIEQRRTPAVRHWRDWLWPAWALASSVAAALLWLRHDALNAVSTEQLAVLTPVEASAVPAPEQPIVVAVIDGGRRWSVLVSAAQRPSAQQDWELWAIPRDGAPISLGTVTAGRLNTVTPPPPEIPLKALAISVEPRGGSPTGQPTGPVRFVHPLQRS